MATVEEAVLRVKLDPTQAATGAKQAERAFDQVAVNARKAVGDVMRLESAVDTVGDTFGRLKGVIAGALGGLAIGTLIKKTVDEVVAYEEALVNVTNVTKFTTEETEAFTAAIDDAVMSMPLAEDGIMSIARAAAQMGVSGSDNLAQFSITMQELAHVTGTNGTEAAQSILRLFRATGTATDQADEFASTLVRLGDTTGTSVGEILALSTKLAGRGGRFKMAAEDVAALAAGMSAMGAEGRMAIQGVTQVMDAMQDAISAGGDTLSNLGTLMGMTGEEARAAFAANSTDAMLKFVEGLNQAERAGVPLTKALESIGSKSEQLGMVLPVVVSNVSNMRSAIESARGEMGSASALTDQMSAKSQTLGARLEILKNTISEAFEEGKVFSDMLKSMVDFASGVVRAFFGMESAANPVTTAMRTAASVLKGLIAGLTAFAAINGAMTFLTFAKSVTAAGGAMKALNLAMAANPIGIVAVAIGGLIALYQQFKDETFQIGEETWAVSDVVLGVWDTIRNRVVFVFETIYEVAAWAWEGIVKAARWVGEQIEKLIGPVLTWFQENWRLMLDGVLGFIKKFVNLAIALLKSVIDVNVLLIKKIIEAGKAFGEIEFSADPRVMIASFQRVGDKLSEALDPSRAWKEIKSKVVTNFETDFVGMAVSVGTKFAEKFALTLEENPALKKAARLLFGTGEIDNLLENIAKRRAARLAAAATGGVSGPGQAVGVPPETAAAIAGVAPALTDTTAEATKAKQALDELFKTLQAERDLIVQFRGDQDAMNDARERAEAQVRFQTLAEEVYKDNITAQAEELKKYMSLLEEVQRLRIQMDASLKIDEMNKAIDEERRLLGLSNDERERATVTAQFHAQALRLYAGDMDKANLATDEFRQRVIELQEDRRLVSAFQDMGAAIANAFADAAFNAENFSDVLESLLKQMTQIAFSQLVMQPLMGQFGGLVGGLFAANGAVLNQGRVMPFARGGVVNGPTVFPMARGGVGVMGEAGPEAIMPLGRDQQGRLGVRGNGGGVTINVYTPDAESFRQSRPQLLSQMNRLTRGGG